jgi:hypothetical protein
VILKQAGLEKEIRGVYGQWPGESYHVYVSLLKKIFKPPHLVKTNFSPSAL